jgi:hypothetical protein
MQIVIDLAAGGSFELADPDNFRAFSLQAVANAIDLGTLTSAAAAIGRLSDDGEHVFVRPGALRTLAGSRGSDPEWQALLDDMIAFARKSGWVDDGGLVRAHVEWVKPSRPIS